VVWAVTPQPIVVRRGCHCPPMAMKKWESRGWWVFPVFHFYSRTSVHFLSHVKFSTDSNAPTKCAPSLPGPLPCPLCKKLKECYNGELFCFHFPLPSYFLTLFNCHQVQFSNYNVALEVLGYSSSA
jgi:hypothetical protein